VSREGDAALRLHAEKILKASRGPKMNCGNSSMRWPTCPFLEQLGPTVTWMHAQGFQPSYEPQVNGQQEHQPDLDMYISDLIAESEGPLTLMGVRHLISPGWLEEMQCFSFYL